MTSWTPRAQPPCRYRRTGYPASVFFCLFFGWRKKAFRSLPSDVYVKTEISSSVSIGPKGCGLGPFLTKTVECSDRCAQKFLGLSRLMHPNKHMKLKHTEAIVTFLTAQLPVSHIVRIPCRSASLPQGGRTPCEEGVCSYGLVSLRGAERSRRGHRRNVLYANGRHPRLS